MQEFTDRQLIDRELTRYTAAGWHIVSQSDAAFQVMYPHVVEGGLVAVFVVGPFLLGILASLASYTTGAALLSIALVAAALFALGHLCARPKLLYITADQLRTPPTIQHTAKGIPVCSVCHTPNRADAATCRNCSAQFAKA